MNIEHLRRSLKVQWLSYYQENRSWLTRLGIWVSCEGQRRPSSGFILATLSTLEPQLTQILPLVVDLSSNPDRIVMALGLNFNPDEEMERLEALEPAASEAVRMLPASPARLPDRNHTPQPESADRAHPGAGANPVPSASPAVERSVPPAASSPLAFERPARPPRSPAPVVNSTPRPSPSPEPPAANLPSFSVASAVPSRPEMDTGELTAREQPR